MSFETREAPHAELLARELTADVRAWREVIEAKCRDWAERPGEDPSAELRERLRRRLAELNRRITDVLDATPAGAVPDEEQLNFYRLIGAFRGFSEAALVFADSAARVDWPRLREERF